MNGRLRNAPPALILLAGLMVLFETIYFASQRPDYSHIANTISELAESGAANAGQVAYGFFLPTGVLVWLALWLVHQQTRDREASLILAALSCLGTGYAACVFFPCDPGAPIFGSWRTLVHNGLGLVDYGGTGVGFLLMARCAARHTQKTPAVQFLIAGILLLVGLASLSIPAVFPVRGAVQRVTETIQFSGTAFACLLLARLKNQEQCS